MTTTVPRFATIVASNYLANARVLADSVERVYPGAITTVLVTDGVEPAPYPTVVWTTPIALGLDPSSVHQMAAMYDITEFATALKPSLLRTLLRHDDVVVYLDPDIELFAVLEESVDAARRVGIALTPHRLSPAAATGRPSERELLVAGVFNLGFIAVGCAATDFLDWWIEQLRWNCVVAPEEGLFVDQRWVDLGVNYFPHYVVRDPGYNVAWWNLDERTVDDATLRFFHFSGFDPDHPDDLHHRDRAHPRPVPPPTGVVRDLTQAHATRVLAAGWASERTADYSYARAANGAAMTPAVRRVYRAAVLGGKEVPDPFDPAQADAFARWSIRTRRVERALLVARRLYHRLRPQATGSFAHFARTLVADDKH